MRLAEEIIITLGGALIELRPSLRFAMQLERQYPEFKDLVRLIGEGSLTAALDIIAPHYQHPAIKHQIFDAGLDILAPALITYVSACAGFDPDAKPQAKASGPKITTATYLRQLYQMGTGWIGWPPEITLNATPLEISEAMKGRADLLKAVFGSSEKEEAPTPEMLDRKFAAVFSSLAMSRRPN